MTKDLLKLKFFQTIPSSTHREKFKIHFKEKRFNTLSPFYGGFVKEIGHTSLIQVVDIFICGIAM
jgi:hypothetical protein